MKKYYRESAAAILLLLFAAAAITFEFVRINYSADATANSLLSEIVPRLICSALLVAILILLDGGRYFAPRVDIVRLMWCIPCLAVALANFPYSALISGAAAIERTNLIWLFLIKCLAVAVMEEILFRGIIQGYLYGFFKRKKYGALITVAVTSLIFGLFHLVNALTGAGIGSTLMQVGYSFLIGAMLSAVILKTENIYICIALHCIFDVGGLIVPDLGSGSFQDGVFWALTAVAGVVCFIHTLIYLIRKNPSQ